MLQTHFGVYKWNFEWKLPFCQLTTRLTNTSQLSAGCLSVRYLKAANQIHFNLLSLYLIGQTLDSCRCLAWESVESVSGAEKWFCFTVSCDVEKVAAWWDGADSVCIFAPPPIPLEKLITISVFYYLRRVELHLISTDFLNSIYLNTGTRGD